MAQASYGAMTDEGLKEQPLEVVAPYVAEFVGTFMLVFTVGVCSVAGNPVWNATSIATMLMVMIYGLGPISGGHFNPCVSVARGLIGKTTWKKVALYSAVQLVAGLAAGGIYGGVFNASVHIAPKANYGWFHAGVAELFYTAILAFVHMNCVCSARNNPEDDQNHFFGLAIGFVIVAGGYAAGDISGAVFNPAATLGLDVTGLGHTNWGWRFAYIGYQLLGAGLAALLYHLCRFREDRGQGPPGRKLQVEILSAQGLANRDSGLFGDVSDPYVKARVGLTEFRTRTVANNLNPVWTLDNSFVFNLPVQAEPGLLSLEVINDNAVFREQSLGALTVDFRSLPLNQMLRQREKLLGGRGAELEYAICLSESQETRPPTLATMVMSEFLGAFTVMLTVGLCVVGKSPATPWCAGAAVLSMIYSLGNVSGGHFNPAVTLAAVLSGRGVTPWVHGLAYCMAQLVAGILGGLLVADFHQEGPNKREVFDLAPGLQVSGSRFSWGSVFAAELLFTFMIAFVVLAVATVRPVPGLSKQNFQFALAIGSCVTAGGFAIGAVSGGALNPAVAVGLSTSSAVVTTTESNAPWSYCLAYSVFELLGGCLAAGLFRVTHIREYRLPSE